MSWSVVRRASVRAAVHPSVRALTFSLDIFFSETTYRILMKFHKCSCHGPLQNFLKKFDSVKNCGCHGNKTEKILKTLKIFLSETIRVRATKFGMQLYLMGPYQVFSNYSPRVKFDPTPGVTSFTWDYIGKILEISLYVALRPRNTKFCM